MSASLIVAVGRGGAIGRDGDLPWHAPEDLAHFRRVTDGHTLVAGRRTWESIGRPLPRRRMVVVSSRPVADLPDSVTWAASPEEALDQAGRTDPVPVVIGGATVYAALLGRVARIHRTFVDVEVPGADTWFPELDPSTWRVVSSRHGEDPRLTFEVLERVGSG